MVVQSPGLETESNTDGFRTAAHQFFMRRLLKFEHIFVVRIVVVWKVEVAHLHANAREDDVRSIDSEAWGLD